DPILLRVRPHPGERGGHGFLHDFAEMTCRGELLAAAHAAGFDEDDVAADGSPDETDGNTRLLDALVDFLFGAELRHAQKFANDFRSDNHLFRFAFGNAPRLLAHDGADFAFEVADARFARKAVNDFLQTCVREFDLLTRLEPMFRRLLRD